MDDLRNDFYIVVKRGSSKGDRSNVTGALQRKEIWILARRFMACIGEKGLGVDRKAHHDILAKHIYTMIQMFYSHKIIRIGHVDTAIYAFPNEILLNWLEVPLCARVIRLTK